MEQTILECAQRLFLEKGFTLTSTTEIAREAGCNQALVHYYFRTKEHLFQCIFEQKIVLLVSQFFAIDQDGGTFEDKLRRKIEAHYEVLQQNPRLPFLIINEITTNPTRIQALREHIGHLPRRVFADMERELQEEIKQGNIRPISAMDLIFNMLALNVVLFLLRPVLDIPETTQQTLIEHRKQECVETILRSLRP